MKVTAHRKPHQYPYFLSRLCIGVIVACLLPLGIVVALGQFGLFDTLNGDIFYSIITVGLSFMAAMVSLRHINRFPGADSLITPLPILSGWYIAVLGIQLLLKLPHHIFYILMGFIFSVIWLTLQSLFLRKVYQLQLAYVPVGRAGHIHEIEEPIWTVLDTPHTPVPDYIHAIVVDLHSPDLSDEWQEFLADCALKHIPVYNIRQVEESLTGRVKIHHMYENNLGSLLPSPIYIYVKYIIECTMIICALPFVLPVMLIAALTIKLEDGGAIFYKQKRVGYRGREFMVYKFRSMTEDKTLNQNQKTQKGDVRITQVGKIIRRTRIDELPQFLNVIKGEMSLIGPRPEIGSIIVNLKKQIPFYDYRHVVKPGITGWAQVMHGYTVSTEEARIKVEHDFYYIKYFSFWLDLVIFLKTIRTILTGFGSR